MTAKEKEFEFKVNGENFKIENRTPTALEILKIAKEGKAFPNNPGDYALHSVQKDNKTYSGDDRVDLSKDNVFITTPLGPTPVACGGIDRHVR